MVQFHFPRFGVRGGGKGGSVFGRTKNYFKFYMQNKKNKKIRSL